MVGRRRISRRWRWSARSLRSSRSILLCRCARCPSSSRSRKRSRVNSPMRRADPDPLAPARRIVQEHDRRRDDARPLQGQPTGGRGCVRPATFRWSSPIRFSSLPLIEQGKLRAFFVDTAHRPFAAIDGVIIIHQVLVNRRGEASRPHRERHHLPQSSSASRLTAARKLGLLS
jgi:hypothetical protein